ncbi:MAG: Maf-like protein [Parvularculaceae bacterium]|nr:Maf-like protein [Parvularculaceae bacterium]
MSAKRLILASSSAIRARILREAGVAFEARSPGVDENAIKKRLIGSNPVDLAQTLADAKAAAIAEPDAFVLGSDQILEFEGRAHDKPATRAEAADRLAMLGGKTHTLINAVSIARNGKIAFRHVERPSLRMRPLSHEEIERYLDKAGPGVLSSVGAYQVESLGAHLIERIDGDYFSVLGLSLFPVLGFLRAQGVPSFP